MFQRNKKKEWSKDDRFHKLRTYTRHNSTFDPKIHTMSSNGLGFQMKNNVKTDPKKSQGSVLKDILYK